jgi:heme-degrading monooxygenase HmoA
MSADHHLAQVNVGRLLAPLDTPQLADFVAALEPVNALADGFPGFVWRLQDDAGDATSFRAFDDDMMIVNMSVWESAEALADFTYRSGHRDVMRRRREWFSPMDEPHLVLWWVPAGHVPDVEEAKARLELLQSDGPAPAAFTFRTFYPFGAANPISVAPKPGGVTLGRRPG